MVNVNFLYCKILIINCINIRNKSFTFSLFLLNLYISIELIDIVMNKIIKKRYIINCLKLYNNHIISKSIFDIILFFYSLKNKIKKCQLIKNFKPIYKDQLVADNPLKLKCQMSFYASKHRYLTKQIAVGHKSLKHAQQEYQVLIPVLAKEEMNEQGLVGRSTACILNIIHF